jgi:Uma2 family endonuclease
MLEDYLDPRGLGEVFNAPVDLLLTWHDVVEPDLIVVSDPAQVTRRAIEGVPPLVVEILSPSTGQRDRTVEARRYAELGIPHYWIVDPDAHTLECHRCEDGVYRLVVSGQGDVTVSHPDWPGLAIDLAEFWR